MPELPESYKRLIAIGIDKTANLPDLNDMTDRGANPLKPWTASKTVGTIDLIRRHNITDEETFVEKFQQESKISLQTLTDQVYEHQLSYFGIYRYDKDTIFKYTYCCVVLNSLMGNATEAKFDVWAKANGIGLRNPLPVLDQQFHADRLQIDTNGKVTSFISIKPNSFHHNFLQYTDVFAGLQVLMNIKAIPWKIYWRDGEIFRLIELSGLNSDSQKKIKEWAAGYSSAEVEAVTSLLRTL